MKTHVKVWMDYFGIGEQDVVQCERCSLDIASGVHHCQRRGIGGNKNLDHIENLGGVCMACHRILDTVPEENERFMEECKDLEFRKRRMRRLLFGIEL